MTNDDRSHIEELAHLYVDGAFDRRELLKRVAGVTGSIAAAAVALESIGLAAERQDARGGADRGVIHENRGLNEHIRDVTRRAARSGFVALGIDLLSRLGGTPGDPEEALRLYQQTTPEGRLADMLSALGHLQGLDIVRGDKLGTVGFCAGGGNVWSLALNTDLLAAAVVYYGVPVPPLDALANLRPPVLAIYAELDRNITRAVLPAILRLEELQKPFGFHIYEGTRHAFHNDTGANYDRLAACDAWCKTTAFFEKHLG